MFLLSLPHAVETQQWGDNLVFWVGDKAIGGKMFALIDLGVGLSKGVAMYSAGPERYAELVEREGLIPAPYMARIHWVAAERWDALRNAEWEEAFSAAHAITYAKLPKHVKEALALSPRELQKLVAGRRKLLACKAKEGACETPPVKTKKTVVAKKKRQTAR
jgi:predicted DNA-binding protein (MmcQ/YjbR family)